MSSPLLIAVGIGGTVEWYAPVRPDAAPTVGVVGTSGVAIVAPLTAATLDTVATTLAVGAAVGSKTLSVAAGAGILPDRRYLVSGGVAGQGEHVEVESVSGTSVTLKYATVFPHAAAAAFVGTRISYVLLAGAALVVSSHCRAKFSWAVAAVAQPEGVVDFVLTRHPLYCPVTIADLLAERPMLERTLTAGTNFTQIIERAWDETLDALWSRGVLPESVSGSNRLRRPVVYRALLLCAEQWGAGHATERDYYAARADALLEVFVAAAAIDDDSDNAIEGHERHQRGEDLYRA